MPVPATPWAWAVNLVAAAGWAVIAVLATFIVVRIVRPDTNLILIWASAYTFWLYLPAYAVGAFAGVFRKWALLGAAGGVAMFHLAWILPDYRPAEAIPAGAETAPHITVMTANIFFENPDYSAMVDEMLAVDPDVVLVQEFGPRFEEEMEARASEQFPYREVAYENRFFGLAVYSKFPLQDFQVLDAGTRPVMAVTVERDGKQVRLFNVHPTSPGLGAMKSSAWNKDWSAIVDLATKEDLPLVIAGDFNMNQHHRWYNELEQEGFDSCHDERGRGNATTWPKGRKLRPIRIDQVFHNDGVVCMDVREGNGQGSDHKPVIAELSLFDD